ncbi:hypothetical protein [Ornithinibacillus scapharcae]|uniref:hypothetical protein n=1 Tax=Ornithinibacillus scapharcae TaxID=1147159 RepID=UPI000225BD6C|nr:hypothetical protein [Ornithinibacillus scapharcae]
MQSIFYIIKFNHRTIMVTLVILFMALVYNCYQFFYNETVFEPANSLIMSSTFVQVGIFLFMIYGVLASKVLLNKREYTVETPLISWFRNVCFIAILSVAYNFIFFIAIIIPMFSTGMPMDINEVMEFIFIYWELPFLISGIIGMTIHMIWKRNLVYIPLILLASILGPLGDTFINDEFYQYISLFHHNPTFPYHPLYGLPIDQFNISKRLIILCLSLVIFPLYSIFFGKFINKRVTLFMVILIFTLGYVHYEAILSKQVIISHGDEPGSTIVKEPLYYKEISNTRNTLIPLPLKQINGAVNINEQRIKAELILSLEETGIKERNYSFSLYHDLVIHLITDLEGNPLKYSRNADIITINSKIDAHDKIKLIYSGEISPLYPVNKQSLFLPSFFPWLPSNTVGQAFINVYDGVVHRTSSQPKNYIHYDLRIESNHKKVMLSNIEHSNGRFIGKSKGITLFSNHIEKVNYQEYEYVIPSNWINIKKDLPIIKDEGKQFIRFINSTLNKNLNLPKRIIIFPLTVKNDYLIEEDIWHLDDHLFISYPFYFTMKEGSITSPARLEELVIGMSAAFTWKADSFEWNDPDMMQLFDAFVSEVYFRENKRESNYFETIVNSISISNPSMIDTIDKLLSIVNRSENSDVLENLLYQWYESAKNLNGNFSNKDLMKILEGIK